MAIKTRKDAFGDLYTTINTPEIYATSRLVATITGVEPQQNKAIVGKKCICSRKWNSPRWCFKTSRNIHIMKPEDVGVFKDSH